MTPRRPEILSVSVALAVPLAVGAAAAAGARAAGADPSATAAVFYSTALVTCLIVARRRGGGPGVFAAHGWWSGLRPGIGFGLLRLVPWLLLAQGHLPDVGPATVIGAAAVVLLAAVAEEVQFRGLLLPRLGVLVGGPAAIAVTTALFTALHVVSVPPALLAVVAADAVAFAVLARSRHGLRAACGMHAAINLGSVLWVPAASVPPAVVAAYVLCAIAVDIAVVAHVCRSRATDTAPTMARPPAASGVPA